ncbi:capsular associated protein [Actinomortierella ambigua]|nr:capsular associated protein [Actinomortierella ambigua]
MNISGPIHDEQSAAAGNKPSFDEILGTLSLFVARATRSFTTNQNHSKPPQHATDTPTCQRLPSDPALVPPRYKNLIDQKLSYYIALNLSECERVLGDMLLNLVRVIQLLGGRVFISIVENGSPGTDQTKPMLGLLEGALSQLGVPFSIQTDNAPRTSRASHDRIIRLAHYRNEALVPLRRMAEDGQTFDRIVFMNDVVFCPHQVLELLVHSVMNKAHITCGIDHDLINGEPQLYDTWVTRDITGNAALKDREQSFVHHPPSHTKFLAHQPFQAYCCWNGMAILDPTPFSQPWHVRFRDDSTLIDGSCGGSECSILCSDFWDAGFNRVVIVPQVRLGYDLETFVELEKLEDMKELDSRFQRTVDVSELVQFRQGPPAEPLTPVSAGSNGRVEGVVLTRNSAKAAALAAATSGGGVEDHIDVVGLDNHAPISPTEEYHTASQTSQIKSEDEDDSHKHNLRSHKAAIDSDMDTDDLLDTKVKTKQTVKGRPRKTDGEPKEPKPVRKYNKKKSAFSDEEDAPAVKKQVTIQSSVKRGTRAQQQFSLQQNRVPFVKHETLDFDPDYVYGLARQYPDNYWRHHAESKSGMINRINDDHPLEIVDCNIHDQAPITGMILSPDGKMLVTFCNYGSAKVWSLEDYSLLVTLRDAKEEHIDEFYVGEFAPNQTKLVVGGKVKDRNNWSETDDDNNILPCPLKLFDVLTGEVITRLEGHTEELLCVKQVEFKGENYFLSGSQDGYINKWHMGADWSTLESMVQMSDGITCMAFTVSFVPNTGNKYFLAACDENLRLYDFENAALLQTFENIYSSYCDCGKFIQAVDFPSPPALPQGSDSAAAADISHDVIDPTESEVKRGKRRADVVVPEPVLGPKPQQYAYFISRGVELLDSDERMIAKEYNTCTLHKLIYPDSPGGKWYLTEVKRYQDDEYYSNAWLIKIASNGRYIMAPTCTGEVFVFNMKTGQVTGILKDHDDVEVRDVIFHPTRPLLFTSGDDGRVKVYTYQNREDLSQALKDSEERARREAEAEAMVAVASNLSAVSVRDRSDIHTSGNNAGDEDDDPEINIDEVDDDLTE